MCLPLWPPYMCAFPCGLLVCHLNHDHAQMASPHPSELWTSRSGAVRWMSSKVRAHSAVYRLLEYPDVLTGQGTALNVAARIESGHVKVGDNVLVQPAAEEVVVKCKCVGVVYEVHVHVSDVCGVCMCVGGVCICVWRVHVCGVCMCVACACVWCACVWCACVWCACVWCACVVCGGCVHVCVVCACDAYLELCYM